MVVGVLSIRLVIRESHSLKDRRRVLRGLKDGLHHTFNISVAEVGERNFHQMAELGISLVGTDRRTVESTLSRVVNYVSGRRGAEIVDWSIEFA